MSILIQVLTNRIIMTKFRFFYAFTMDLIFLTAIGYKWYGYASLRGLTGGLLLDRTKVLPVDHPINIGANLYGVACCMAFLKVIFLFEIHHRFGPILFCIKNVFWDILSIVGSFLVTVFAFAVGLVSVFGIFDDNQTRFSDFTSATKTLFWVIFDPGKEEYADIETPESNGPTLRPPISGGLLKPFPIPGFNQDNLATVRPPSDVGDSLSHNFGIVIWGFYQVFVVLIMMNLLISLMTTTFAKIQRNADVEWKFTRASIWIHYYDDLNSIPAPLNVIPSVYTLRKIYLWICYRGRLMEDVKTWTSSKLIAQESKRRLYDTLIERRNADVEWKFTRASIWIHYYDDLNSIPAPLNVIPSVYTLRKIYLWICYRGRLMEDVKTWTSSKLIAQESKRRLYDTLIERVFRSEEKKQDSRVGRADIEALEKEISIDIADLRRDIRTLRKDLSLPTHKFITPRDGYPMRKISAALAVTREDQAEGANEMTLPMRQTFRDFASIKVDNRPEVVQHLVQTLGLIGVSTEAFASDDFPSKRQSLERHNSIV
eukprot:maker-scaffold735_size104922-snap-gene-0.26 protein:Tk08164 transcript:maker-scaffold735_size104922-snap-gene-0.26-mRNA-1 annotation:"short transient receptor potential channel 7-like"